MSPSPSQGEGAGPILGILKAVLDSFPLLTKFKTSSECFKLDERRGRIERKERQEWIKGKLRWIFIYKSNSLCHSRESGNPGLKNINDDYCPSRIGLNQARIILID